MIRVFDRYLSIRNTLYFVFENLLIVLFLIGGGLARNGWSDLVLVPLVVQACLHYNEVYPSSQFSLREFWRRYLVAILWAAGILAGIYILLPGSPVVRENVWKRWLAFPFILIGLRMGYQSFVLHRRWEQPVLVVGSGRSVVTLRAEEALLHSLGYRLIHLPWEGLDSPQKSLQSLKEMVTEHKIGKVVIALRDRRKQIPMDVLVNLRVQGVEVVEAISFYEQISGKIPVEWLNPSHLIFGEGFHRFTSLRVAKRSLDILLAGIGLVLGAPLFLLLALLIKMDSQGPILYRQERVGEKGRLFTLLKFRSMQQDAESESGPVWASEKDPRVTRVGRMMRNLRLDEIPQLLNVLRGEMSFVGPRPEREMFVRQLREKIPYYDLRLTVKPGLTGWAQVKHRYAATEGDVVEKLQYDLYYIKHLSPLFDLTIILDTLGVVVSGRGAQ
jgi:sugar transferase (PEP-CTERM system associated)